MIDLASLSTVEKAEEGVKFYFTHPVTREKLTTFMIIKGTDSKTFKTLKRQKMIKALNERAVKSKDEKITVEKLEQADEEDLITISHLIIGFGDEEKGKEVDYIIFNGEKLKYSVENALTILKAIPPFAEQIAGAVADRTNFF